MIKELLNKNNIKATNQRIEILSVLKDSSLTIKEICDLLSNIDKSTIYRTLELFINKNIIDKSIINNVIVYEIKEQHRHYLNCIKCHKRVEIKNCPFDCEEIEGFKVLNHSINIDGICNTCQKDL